MRPTPPSHQEKTHRNDHEHDQGHVPTVTEDSERRIFWVMCLTGSYMVVQVIGGIFSGSLALIADSGHMLSDTAALGLAWFAFKLAKKPADEKRTYGYHRFQILAAFTNGLTLFFIAGWITIEAIDRLINPKEVLSTPMLFIATIGLVINLIGFLILHRGSSHNVNMQGALLHVLGDLLGSVAAILAAVIIMLTGWFTADPLLSLVVALIIVKSGFGLIKRSGHILLEGTPEHLDLTQVKQSLESTFPDILDAHHLHAWSLTAEKTIITLHIRINKEADMQTLLHAISSYLETEFDINHATIQFESDVCCD